MLRRRRKRLRQLPPPRRRRRNSLSFVVLTKDVWTLSTSMSMLMLAIIIIATVTKRWSVLSFSPPSYPRPVTTYSRHSGCRSSIRRFPSQPSSTDPKRTVIARKAQRSSSSATTTIIAAEITSTSPATVSSSSNANVNVDANKNKNNSAKKQTSTIHVGIVGAGAIAFATASILHKNGHDSMIWSPRGGLMTELNDNESSSHVNDDNDDDTVERMICTATNCRIGNDDNDMDSHGGEGYNFQPRIATDLGMLVQQNDVILIAIPANGHKQVMDELIDPLIEISTTSKKKFHIIISSHSSLGALYLSDQLHRRFDEYYHNNIDSNNDNERRMKKTNKNDSNNNNENSNKIIVEDDSERHVGRNAIFPTITAWGTTVCTARKQEKQQSSTKLSVTDVHQQHSRSHHRVDIKTIRDTVDYCTLPDDDDNDDDDNGDVTTDLSSLSGSQLCQQLFPHTHFRKRDGLLAISLSNVNPQNHLGMSLGNISRMDQHETWYQFDKLTPSIGSVLEALDQERLDIANALGVDVKTIFEHFESSFHVPISSSISEMAYEIHRQGNDVYGPNTADSRYVLEDVPFGLALTVQLGKLTGHPARLHQAGMMICSAMYGRDFETENDLLHALQLDSDQMTLNVLQQAVRTGRLPSNMSTPEK